MNQNSAFVEPRLDSEVSPHNFMVAEKVLYKSQYINNACLCDPKVHYSCVDASVSMQ